MTNSPSAAAASSARPAGPSVRTQTPPSTPRPTPPVTTPPPSSNGAAPYTPSSASPTYSPASGRPSWNDSPGYAGYAGPTAGSTGGGAPGYQSNVDVAEANPGSQAATEGADTFSPRVARLTVASVDPFSAMKLSFLLSVAAGVALVVAVIVLWLVLSSIGVFTQLNNVLGDLGLNTQTRTFDIYDYIGFGRVVSLAVVVAVANTLLLTALGTIMAFLYNLSAGLVGGVRVTLSDD